MSPIYTKETPLAYAANKQQIGWMDGLVHYLVMRVYALDRIASRRIRDNIIIGGPTSATAPEWHHHDHRHRHQHRYREEDGQKIDTVLDAAMEIAIASGPSVASQRTSRMSRDAQRNTIRSKSRSGHN